jgi:NAD(P)-dependent dehydrogenase (short-subunit alcohol dehydrogenase family)
MSKAAIRAFGGSLRQELWLDGARHVKVCTVLPAAIDTPLFDHAANCAGPGDRAADQHRTGQVLISEHGPTGWDEANRIEPGRNYGWDPSRGGTSSTYDETFP